MGFLGRLLRGERRPEPKPRVLAALSYLGILCLIPLIVNRDNRFVEFHARQGFILWVWLLLAIFSLVVPVLGMLFFRGSLSFILLLSILGLVSVIMGRFWQLPLVGRLAAKLL